MIHQRFRESTIQVLMLSLKGHKANQIKHFKLLCKKLRENGKLLVGEPRNKSGNVSKGTKWAVSEILGQQRYNTAVFRAIVNCTKRQLKAAIFKTGKDQSKGENNLKTSKKISFWRQYRICLSYEFLSKSWQINPPARKEFLRKTTLQTWLFVLTNPMILHTFLIQLPNLDKL